MFLNLPFDINILGELKKQKKKPTIRYDLLCIPMPPAVLLGSSWQRRIVRYVRVPTLLKIGCVCLMLVTKAGFQLFVRI